MTVLNVFRPILLAALLIVGLLGLWACGPKVDPAEDARFEALAGTYLEGLLELNPEWATNLGDHRFDGQVSDLSEAGFQAHVAFNQAVLDSLDTFDPAHLSQVNRIDYEILRDQAQAEIFMITEVREYQWNPTIYNPGDGIYNLLARDFAPLADRLASVKQRLQKLPGQLEQAKLNLVNPPRVMTETAMTQNVGVITLIMDELQRYLQQEPQLQDEFVTVRATAIGALQAYGTWLETDLLPRSKGDFRLGETLWRQKLKYSLGSDLSPEEILASAQADLVSTRAQMFDLALPLYEKLPGAKAVTDTLAADRDHVIRTVLDHLAEQKPTNETIVAQAEADLVNLTEFVRAHDLVAVPDDPLELIVMPEHQRGFYIAYCDSPGPLETNGKTFYAISPTPKHWSPERAATFYREYNNFMLLNLSIHEAMPGHYLQIAHANKFEAPTPLRAILGSGTFIEGWATYSEQLMVEAGHGGPQVHLQQLKMRLRLLVNAIIDQKIHTAGMTEDQAMEMMMVDAFQEEGEAAGKWVRACLTSTQLSTYYVGNMELNRLRRDYQAKVGDDYSHRTYHDLLLSFGSPPAKYVRELMEL